MQSVIDLICTLMGNTWSIFTGILGTMTGFLAYLFRDGSVVYTGTSGEELINYGDHSVVMALKVFVALWSAAKSTWSKEYGELVDKPGLSLSKRMQGRSEFSKHVLRKISQPITYWLPAIFSKEGNRTYLGYGESGMLAKHERCLEVMRKQRMIGAEPAASEHLAYDYDKDTKDVMVKWWDDKKGFLLREGLQNETKNAHLGEAKKHMFEEHKRMSALRRKHVENYLDLRNIVGHYIVLGKAKAGRSYFEGVFSTEGFKDIKKLLDTLKEPVKEPTDTSKSKKTDTSKSKKIDPSKSKDIDPPKSKEIDLVEAARLNDKILVDTKRRLYGISKEMVLEDLTDESAKDLYETSIKGILQKQVTANKWLRKTCEEMRKTKLNGKRMLSRADYQKEVVDNLLGIWDFEDIKRALEVGLPAVELGIMKYLKDLGELAYGVLLFHMIHEGKSGFADSLNISAFNMNELLGAWGKHFSK